MSAIEKNKARKALDLQAYWQLYILNVVVRKISIDKVTLETEV